MTITSIKICIDFQSVCFGL